MRLTIVGALAAALALPAFANEPKPQPIQLRVKRVLCVAPSGPFPGDTMKYIGAAIHGDPEGRIPGPINGMQGPMEYGVPVIAMMGPKGQAAAVGITAGMEAIKASYEIAKFFDENRVPDDLYIKVNGQKIWPQGRTSQKIKAGQEISVGAIAPPAVGGQHRIELWEHDDGVFEGGDDLLGDLNFGAGGGLERTVTFTLSNKSEGSVYMVEVEFFRPPPPPVTVRAEGAVRNANARTQMCSFRDNLRGAAPIAGQRATDLVADLPPVDMTARTGGFGDMRASGLSNHEAKFWQPRLDAVAPQATSNVRRGGLAWTWDVPAKGITFGRQEVVVPYAVQNYRDSNGNGREVRWIAGAPQSTGATYLKLPLEGEFKGDPNPISMEKLKPWLDCLSPQKRRAAEPVLRRMRAQGYLVDTEAEVAMVTRGLTIAERIKLGRSVENIRAAITEGGFQPTVSDLNAAVGAGSDDKEVVNLLLELGARPDAGTMSRAVQAKEPEMVTLLSSKGAPINAGHVRDALASQDHELLKVVMQRGGSAIVGLTTQDLKGALDARDLELANMLVDAGAPSTPQTLTQALTTRDAPLIAKVGRATPPSPEALALAMESGDPALISTFTSRGARLKDNGPLYKALAMGDVNMVKLGLQHGGNAEELLKHAMLRRSSVGIGLAIQGGADPDPVVRWTIQQNEARLFVDLVTVHRADAQQALYTAISLSSPPYAELAISKGRANPTEALPSQVRAGKADWIAFLINAGADPSAGVEPAIDVGRADTLSYLIGLGAKAGEPQHVRKAAEKANMAVLEVVIEDAGGKPDEGMAVGVDQDHLEVVAYLLSKGAKPTGVHVPAARGKLPMVKLLVEGGANPTEGIEQAVRNNRDEVAIYLLDKGASPAGMMPIAAGNGRIAICRKLIAKGISPNEGTTAAVQNGQAEATQFLIGAGADVSAPALIGLGVTENHPAVVQVLVAGGAPAKHVDEAGDTFLHIAARDEGHAELVAVLLKAGVPVDAVNGAGDTALLGAVRVGNQNEAVVQALVSAGANVNATDGEGRIVWKEAKGPKVKRILKDAGAERK